MQINYIMRIVLPLWLYSFSLVKAKPARNDTNSNIWINENQSECIDNHHNIIHVHSQNLGSNKPNLEYFEALSYTPDHESVCSNGRGLLNFPGILQLTKGKLKMPKQYDLVNKAYIRLTASTEALGYLCKDGKSKNFVIPNHYCRFRLCENSRESICKVIEKHGEHTLEELVQKANFNTTVELPAAPSLISFFLANFLSDDYDFSVAIEYESEEIVKVHIPSNSDTIRVEVD